MGTILDSLIDYSKTNIPMLLLESMHGHVRTIWEGSGRESIIEIKPETFSFSDVVVYAQEDYYDAIEIRSVENLDEDYQERLAHLLTKLEPRQRGKFILTAEDFTKLNPALAKILCKIDFSFPCKSSYDRQIQKKSDPLPEQTFYEFSN